MDFIVNALFLPPQASTFAVMIDTLHAFIFGTTLVGCAIVLTLAVFFIVRYHESRDVPRKKRSGYASTPFEVAIIGTITTLFVLWWGIGFWQYKKIVEPPDDAVLIHVSAKQWVWKFEHSTGASELGTLTVPLGVPVKLVMTSRDVIHSFFVPPFRIKHDVVPGRTTIAWFEATKLGEFPIRCAELCGAGHPQMLGAVRVVPADEYRRMVATADPRRGVEAAARVGCLSCHSLDGEPRVGPSWKGVYGSRVELTSGGSVIADDEYLTRSMMDPGAEVVLGFADIMPSFRGQLSPEDAAAILELIRSLSGVQVGPLKAGHGVPALQGEVEAGHGVPALQGEVRP